MTNKEMIKKLKDNAELAWASYFYFDLLKDSNNTPRKIYELDKQGNKIKDKDSPRGYKEIELTLEHIISQKYKGQEVLVNLKEDNTWQSNLLNILDEKTNTDKLNGEFSEIQAQKFLKKYNLLDYYPKNNSKGFHACLFQDKESKEHTLAIRGSYDSKDYAFDFTDLFIGSNVPFDYLYKMISFYEECAKKYPAITKPNSLNIVGHSLGGALAQLFALSFADDKQRGIINEVYTFNSPGAKDLKLYDIIIYIPNIPNDTMKEFLSQSLIKTFNQKAQELYLNTQDNDLNQKLEEMLNNTANNTYLGINFYFHNDEKGTLTFAYEKVPYDFLTAYQTLIYNYNNKDKDNYRLSISDKVFHIESKNQADDNYHAKESYPRNATQHLGKDIEGNYFSINLNFEGINSHKIVEITKVLYFYEYLYEMNESLIDEQSKKVQLEYEKDISKENKEDDTPKKFFKKHSEIDTKEYKESKKALEYCNLIALSIHKILYNIELAKVEKKGTLDDNSCIPPPPNWLYAMIDRVAFEATLLTKQDKFLVKNNGSNIIEAILYLQENKVYIQILEEEIIKNIKEDSPLSYLFAIFEYLFFISVDENKNPLVEDKQISCSLLGYKTPKIKIFCSSPDELLIQCYKNETLRFYPLLKMAQ